MKRLWLTLLPLLFLPIFIFAQHDTVPDSLRAWHKGAQLGFNFTQASFTNWAAGGVNSISGQAMAGAFLRYKKDSVSWENNLDLNYGLLQQGGKNTLRKTDDKLEFTSKAGVYAFSKVWYYSALVNFKTQFTPGYNYFGDTAKTLISDFMSPAYLVLAIGLDYKPNKKFSVLLAPVTGRTTFVLNQSLADQGAFGVKAATYDTGGVRLVPGERVRYEFGGYLRATYSEEVMPNVKVAAKLELFSNYIHEPQNVDVNAEVGAVMKVNKYISATVKMQAIYDNDVQIAVDNNHDGVIDGKGPRLQFYQMLGVGFLVKI